MKPFRILGLLTILASVSVGCAYKNRPLLAPTIAVQPGTSTQTTEHVVREALNNHDWVVKEEGNGYILAEQDSSGLTAVIKVTYDDEKVKIDHVSSNRLNYQNTDGKETIQGRYNRWVDHLEDDIEKGLHKEAERQN